MEHGIVTKEVNERVEVSGCGGFAGHSTRTTPTAPGAPLHIGITAVPNTADEFD